MKKIYFLVLIILGIFYLGNKTVFAYYEDPEVSSAKCIILTTSPYQTEARNLAAFHEGMSGIGTPQATDIYYLDTDIINGEEIGIHNPWQVGYVNVPASLGAYGQSKQPPLANPEVFNSFNASGDGDFFSNGANTPGWSAVASAYNGGLARQILSFILDLADAPGYQPPLTGFVSAPLTQQIILLGNTSDIPPSDYEYIVIPVFNNGEWYPTDHFYACASNNGLGLTTGILSLVPNFAIGRLPVNNTTEASTIVSKITSWFSNINSSDAWFKNVSLAGGGRDVIMALYKEEGSKFLPDVPGPPTYWGEMAALNVINSLDLTKDNKSYLSGMNVTKYFWTNPAGGGHHFTENDVNNLLSAGSSGFVYLFGDGDASDFYFEDNTELSISNFNSYSSNHNIPVIISSGDDNTQYDTLDTFTYENTTVDTTVNPLGNSLGKSALLSKGGAIAFIGPSRDTSGVLGGSYFDSGVFNESQIYFLEMMAEFAKEYHEGGTQSNIGNMYEQALADYFNINYSPNPKNWDLYNFMTMIESELFGDPTLYIPGQVPSSTEDPLPVTQPVNPGNGLHASLPYDSMEIPVYEVTGGGSQAVTTAITVSSALTNVTADLVDTRYSVNDYTLEQQPTISSGTGSYSATFYSQDTGEANSVAGQPGPGFYIVRISNQQTSNDSMAKEVRQYVEVVNQFVPSGDILVVLNDQWRWTDKCILGTTSETPANYEDSPYLQYYDPTSKGQYFDTRLWYINALNSVKDSNNNPVQYAIWNVVNLQDGNLPAKPTGENKYGEITQEALDSYRGTGSDGKNKIVIWVTGKNDLTTFSLNDQTFVDNFLSNGGRLFVTGQDIGYNIGSSGFYTNELKAIYDQDDINRYNISGVKTDSLSSTLSDINITSGDGAQDNPDISNFPDEIDPQPESSPCCLQYTEAAGPGGPKSLGGAGVKYYNSTTGEAHVYFSFGFERIDNPSGTNNGRGPVLQAVLNWLKNPTQTGVFTATPGNNLINLNWAPLPSGQTGILIYYKIGGYPTPAPTNGTSYSTGQAIGDGTVIYVGGTSPTNWTHMGLTNGTTYYYDAYSFDASHNYNPFGNAFATPSANIVIGALAAPSNLTATANLIGSNWRVTLNWQDNSTNPNEDGFTIARRTVQLDGTYADTVYFTVGQDITTYTDVGPLTADTTYSYIVRAFINAPPQQSAWSNEAIVATVVLQPPTNLTAIAAYITTPSNRPEVILHWTNNSLGQQGIDVERKHPTPANPYPSYVQIATAGPTDSTFVDSGPGLFCDGRPYYYRIKAYNAGSSTLYSNEAWATPSAFPPGQNPTNLIFEPGVNGFTVTWSDYITTAIPVKNYLVEGWSTPPSDTAFPDTVITIPVTDVTTGETTITAVVTLSYPTTELWYTRVIAQASNGQFSLYATNDSNPSLDYASGDIFLNSPTSSSGGGGGGPLGPLAIGISGLLTWLKLRKRR